MRWAARDLPKICWPEVRGDSSGQARCVDDLVALVAARAPAPWAQLIAIGLVPEPQAEPEAPGAAGWRAITPLPSGLRLFESGDPGALGAVAKAGFLCDAWAFDLALVWHGGTLAAALAAPGQGQAPHLVARFDSGCLLTLYRAP